MSEKIGFGDFAKLDLRVGEIKKVEAHPNADRLFVLTVDLGPEIGERTICAGLREHYSIEGLVGKRAIFVVNLEKKMLRGVESDGMILAASSEGKESVKILIVDGELEVGSRVS